MEMKRERFSEEQTDTRQTRQGELPYFSLQLGTATVARSGRENAQRWSISAARGRRFTALI
jgi:hypothetical protein